MAEERNNDIEDTSLAIAHTGKQRKKTKTKQNNTGHPGAVGQYT